MNILFAHPLFLGLLPLALTPVIFHLFFRIRRKALPFSTFMFFQRIHPRLSARRKIREWLILLLRALAVALLLLAFAGPSWSAGGRGGRIAAVLVLDNSASMTRRDASGQSLLEAAKAAARAALDTLDAGDSAALLLTVRDPAAPRADTLARDRDGLRAALKAIPSTEAAGAPADTLRRALALLAAAPAARREIHVFTDLQENEWNEPGEPPALPGGLSLRFHRLIPAEPPPNATLASLSLPNMRLLASRAMPLSVEVQAGAQPVSILVNWLDDGGRPGAIDVRLAAEETKRVVLPLVSRTPGTYTVPVWISGDDFEGDNRAIASFTVQPKQAVLFLGPSASFGLLPAALSPGGDASLSGLEPVFAAPSEAVAQLDARNPLLVVIPGSLLPPVGPLPNRLRRYVLEGGRLLVVPDPTAQGVPDPGPAWLGFKAGPVETPEEPVRLMPLAKQFLLRNEGDEERLGRVRVLRFMPLTFVGPIGPIGLVGLEDGRPLLTSVREGAGDVLVSGLALTGDWSNLPFKPLFLVLAHEIALAGRTDGSAEVTQLGAGNRFQSQRQLPPGPVRLQADTVPPIVWQGDVADLPVPSRTGLWTIESGTNQFRFAVSASFSEGRFAELKGPPVPAAMGLPHTIRSVSSARDLADSIRRTRQGTRLFHPLLIACLLALVAEGLLANPRMGGVP